MVFDGVTLTVQRRGFRCKSLVSHNAIKQNPTTSFTPQKRRTQTTNRCRSSSCLVFLPQVPACVSTPSPSPSTEPTPMERNGTPRQRTSSPRRFASAGFAGARPPCTREWRVVRPNGRGLLTLALPLAYLFPTPSRAPVHPKNPPYVLAPRVRAREVTWELPAVVLSCADRDGFANLGYLRFGDDFQRKLGRRGVAKGAQEVGSGGRVRPTQ